METQVVIRMPRDLRDALERAAEEDERSLANFARVLLKDALAARAKGRRRQER